MDLSVVIPVRNEADNVLPLLAEIRAALDGKLEYEVIFVDDGSTDETAARLQGAQAGFDRLRLVRHAASCGQSTAVRTGVQAATAPWIVTLDGDGQNDPADIPAMWERTRAAGEGPGPALVAGVRRRRHDSWVKRWSSRIANRVRRRLLRDDARDTGCGLKMFRRDAYLELPYFDHMHRFLPALIRRHGGIMVEQEINHRPRQAGRSNYGTLDRLFVGITDMLGVMWLQRRTRLPVILDDGKSGPDSR